MRLEHRRQLSPDEVRAVVRLVDDATDTDGVRPLSEHVMLHLRYGGDSPARNLLAYRGDQLVGYAHLDATDPVEGPSAELVVAPTVRRDGVGRQLVADLLASAGESRLRLWAHGGLRAARELARSLGFRSERVLWQMRRSLYAPLPAPELPDGVRVRTFAVGQDEDAWVRVNNRAFAGHPDQSGWSRRDIEMREQEPWFDPEGFFLADRDERLVGFHWTKVHGAGSHGAHDHEPIGEVYVVGVDPDEQGSGLGRALTLVGLRHLRAAGLAQAMLYVDETNERAIHVYGSLGFTKWDVDVRYCRDVSQVGAGGRGRDRPA